MTGAIKMPGGILELGHDGADVVMHVHGGRQARLTPEGQEEFAQPYVAACHQAGANAIDEAEAAAGG